MSKTYCLLLTENCNFACTYCYERDGNGHSKKSMSMETAKKVVEYVVGDGSEDVSLSLFGGEPTLNPEVIDYICAETKRLCSEKGTYAHIGMITNGSILTDKVYDVFSRHLDVVKDVQISIDGDRETQDLTRIDLAGNGTFDIVSRNIPKWRELFPNLSLHGVVSKDTLPMMFHNYKLFTDEWGVDRVWFLNAKDDRFTQEDVDLYDIEMGKIKEHMMDKVRVRGNANHIREAQPFNGAFDNYDTRPKPCGAGNGYLVITTDGDIFPCHNIYFTDVDESTKLGDIYNGVDFARQHVWDAYDDGDMIGCGGCDVKSCFRCPAENWTANGNPFVQDKGNEDTHCSFMKIDKKYQEEIFKEVTEMGLMDQHDGSNKCECGEGECGEIQDEGVVVSDNPNENLKSLLNEVIDVLVKYHNKL